MIGSTQPVVVKVKLVQGGGLGPVVWPLTIELNQLEKIFDIRPAECVTCKEGRYSWPICTSPTVWYVVTYLVEELYCSCGSLADLHSWTTLVEEFML